MDNETVVAFMLVVDVQIPQVHPLILMADSTMVEVMAGFWVQPAPDWAQAMEMLMNQILGPVLSIGYVYFEDKYKNAN